MNLYKQYCNEYLEAGFSVIPDKGGSKAPAIKDWTKYSENIPLEKEVDIWCDSFKETNISVMLGKASGIIAVDFDCTDPEIIKQIEFLFPESPVEKVGAKGWTRFYQYNKEISRTITFNGSVVFEILSDGKKTTLPPSIHPNGMVYEWVGKSLKDVKVNELDALAPRIVSSVNNILSEKFPEVSYKDNKFYEGRNNNLREYAKELMRDMVPFDTAIKHLIKKDEEVNDPPLFSDPSEASGHTERFTNAGRFYFNILNSINTHRMRKNQSFLIPSIASAVNETYTEVIKTKKIQGQVSQKKSNPELPVLQSGVLGAIQKYILENSFIQQPAFAFSAALALLAVIVGRKFVFEGGSSNLYILNVAPSGTGKDAPQQRVKDILIDLRADWLLGAGDYVSDASLMDSLESAPVRLDIIDEAGGLLKGINTGGATFNSKMADILAELYTSSNNKFLGRATAEGIKGSCIRPNVNLLCSTTPAGFSEGVSYKSIEKGLMGRFLIFEGDVTQRANRVRKATHLDDETIAKLKYWVTFSPENSGETTGGITQEYFIIPKTKGANEELDIAFDYYDSMRSTTVINNPNSKLLPIISRLYQQLVKVAMLHAISRTDINKTPEVKKCDILFAKSTIECYYITVQKLIQENIFENKTEENLIKFENLIKSAGPKGMSRSEIYRKTRNITKRDRQDILETLVESEHIYSDLTVKGVQIYKVREKWN